ncbi:Uncharacterized protein conserved in bacteria [Streptococcus sanguinis]|jgi:Uncharacterized protein conserved in bacteria|uniref:Uncharacterized protein conserved in bacteria n=2 Tax=Streptococcus sanguinis TaxID=1305 RepID=A0A2X3YS13_STRSA|nr:Uncharacterized protein conserved in bacteria [Streptococcus sanguinis]
MMEEIKVDISDITIKLPDTYCIVSQHEYDELIKQSSKGRYLSLSDVLELLSVSRPWLLENVLYKPAIRSKIDIEQNPNGGFVKYPSNQGERYLFLASKTKDFFEKNFYEIMVQ